ncbi:hypothetical protein [Kineococcus terrestris]|uniref:hypothetical protein n=1 Tax=Kineococcus terrestris TaxID=2044856 RepID=UPI0034DB0F1E
MSDDRTLTQAVHDLGSALWFGGAVMGIAGVNKSGSDLRDGLDKVRVAGSAWKRFAPVEWAGIGAVLLTGSQLTRSSSQRIALQQGYGTVGALKVGFVLAGAAATAYASYAGARIARAAEEAAGRGETVDVHDATRPSSATPPEVARWQERQRVVQFAIPVLAGGNIVCNAALVQSYRAGATVKGVLGRFLP